MSAIEEHLTLPCAYGGPAGSARVRATPDDFIVREALGFSPDGQGDHLLLRVRKRGANTMWVAKQLARLGKLHSRDVGFAGLKDRDAVAEQWFSVPLRSALGEQWTSVRAQDFEVIDCQRHRRKLKRGALRGNEFEILLREFTGDIAVLEQRLQAIAAGGVPNYFGPQRFGRAGGNIAMAIAWFSGEAASPDREQRGFALSAARSAIFNAVLAERIRNGAWNRLQPGDVANLNGSGSIFAVDAVDEILVERCQRLDIHPTGPLWGTGSLGAAGVVADLERQVADRYAVLSEGLTRTGIESDRRALRTPVDDLRWSIAGADVNLRFRLPRGAFATAVLHELIGNAFAHDVPERES